MFPQNISNTAQFHMLPGPQEKTDIKI